MIFILNRWKTLDEKGLKTVEFTPEIYSRTHYNLCWLKECLDGLPSSESLLSGIQAHDQVVQRAYLTFKKSMSTESYVLSYYVNVKCRFCKLLILYYFVIYMT